MHSSGVYIPQRTWKCADHVFRNLLQCSKRVKNSTSNLKWGTITLNREMLSLMLWKRNYSMRRTKIVCTIGPATNSEAQLEQLMRAGMNVARLNFSHGAQQDHALVIERIRAISTRLDFPIAILQDLQGPKIRVGSLKDGQPVKLVDGATLTITIREIAGTSEIVSPTYKLLPQCLH